MIVLHFCLIIKKKQTRWAVLCGMPIIQYSARSARLSVHKLFTSCIGRGLVSHDSIVDGDWLPASEWCQRYLSCCQPASDVFENFGSTFHARQGNDFELIPLVKIETRNTVYGYFGSEFSAICNHCGIIIFLSCCMYICMLVFSHIFLSTTSLVNKDVYIYYDGLKSQDVKRFYEKTRIRMNLRISRRCGLLPNSFAQLIVSIVCTCVCSHGCVLLLTTVTSFAVIPRRSWHLVILMLMLRMKAVRMRQTHMSLIVIRLCYQRPLPLQYTSNKLAFYPRDAMLAPYMPLSSCVRLSVRLSQADIVSKRLNA